MHEMKQNDLAYTCELEHVIESRVKTNPIYFTYSFVDADRNRESTMNLFDGFDDDELDVLFF